MRIFSDAEMELVRECAEACAEKRSGELSVCDAMIAHQALALSDVQKAVAAFCAEECRRQNEPDGELCVYWYITAWNAACEMLGDSRTCTEDQAHAIACLIEPKRNNEYRQTPVSFRNGNTALAPLLVPRAMSNLFDAQADLSVDELTPQDFYVEYEKIHPRGNGNGRMGKILFNVRNGTLLAPVFPQEPPDFN